MWRLGFFWAGLPLGAKLQFAALGLILGTVFVVRDLDPARRWFGQPLWQITVPLILLTFVAGRMLLPLMLRHPRQAQRWLSIFGMFVFGLGIFSTTQNWGRLMITHVGLTTALWLDASCWFWFISEIQMRAAALQAADFTLAREAERTTGDDQDLQQ